MARGKGKGLMGVRRPDDDSPTSSKGYEQEVAEGETESDESVGGSYSQSGSEEVLRPRGKRERMQRTAGPGRPTHPPTRGAHRTGSTQPVMCRLWHCMHPPVPCQLLDSIASSADGVNHALLSRSTPSMLCQQLYPVALMCKQADNIYGAG